MRYTNNSSCCGLGELEEIRSGTPVRAVNLVADAMFREQGKLKDNSYEGDEIDWSDGVYQMPFIIFTDINDCLYGYALATYIKEHDLGTVYNTVSRLNPRSGNGLRIWVWTVKKKNLKKWYEKQQ